MNINFSHLSNSHSYLKQHLIKTSRGGFTIDFYNPKAVRELCYAILFVEYGLKLEIPLDTLCPPIPNRISYLEYIHKDLLLQNSLEPMDSSNAIHGIDIGTGASCIYPLLGCKLYSNWHFMATEINPISVDYARENIIRNEFSDRIDLILTDSDTILPSHLIISKSFDFDFVMCNPPFYSSLEEMQSLRDKKEMEPFMICTGSSSELVYEGGGELGFCKKMYEESVNVKESVKWFTCLMGKKNDYEKMMEFLSTVSVTHNGYNFVNGNTKRWIVAWSFVMSK